MDFFAYSIFDAFKLRVISVQNCKAPNIRLLKCNYIGFNKIGQNADTLYI